MAERKRRNRIGRGGGACAALRAVVGGFVGFGGHGVPEQRTQCGGPQPPAAEARIARACDRSAGCAPNLSLVGGLAEDRASCGSPRLFAAGSLGRCVRRLSLGALLLAAVGCGGGAGELSEDPGKVNLAIGVDVGDLAAPQEGYADAANDDEKMQTLRVVVVRPDGTIEHNRLLPKFAPTVRLDGTTLRPDGTKDDEWRTFKVVGGERKRIYLFVNEATELRFADGTLHRVIDYDFGRRLVPGTFFPREEVEALCMTPLEGDTQQLEGPLPMTGCHDIWMPREDYACEKPLTVLRAAVKFTFLVKNDYGCDLSLTGLTLDRMADRSWYLPRARYDDAGETTSFEVPASVGYYIFRREHLRIALPEGKTTQLAPIYFFEGQYADPADPRNYAMSIDLEGLRLGGYFENLKSLPRNTHVVVRITLKQGQAMQWQAEVVPYGKVPLEPVFGLD